MFEFIQQGGQAAPPVSDGASSSPELALRIAVQAQAGQAGHNF